MQNLVQHFAKNTTPAVRPSHFSCQFTGLENWGRPLRSELVEGWGFVSGLRICGSTRSPRTSLKLAEEKIRQADV